MIRIALCDDKADQLSLTESMLAKYQTIHPEELIRVESYTSAAALLEHLRTVGTYDIYILDILMPDLNGIDLGVEIRRRDSAAVIFYLTSSPDFAVDSYRTKASQYLLKPVPEEILFGALQEVALHRSAELWAYATVKTRDGLLRLHFDSVIYGELVGHCVHYHLIDGTVVAGMSLRTSFREAVSDFLNDPRFVLCAASFFVNLGQVEMVEHNALRLRGGETLPLSRNLKTEVTNCWLDYHLKGGGVL